MGSRRCGKIRLDFLSNFFCLFDLILYIPVNNFSVMLGEVLGGVFSGLTSTKQRI